MNKRKAVDSAWITQEMVEEARRVGREVLAFARMCGTESANVSVLGDTVFATIFFEDGTRQQYHIDLFNIDGDADVHGIEWEKEDN